MIKKKQNTTYVAQNNLQLSEIEEKFSRNGYNAEKNDVLLLWLDPKLSFMKVT